MNIYGEKIVLRAIRMSDAELLCNIINDPNTEKMLGGSSFPVSLEHQCEWINKQTDLTDTLRCIVARKETVDEGLGTVILSDIDLKNGTAEVHIKLDQNTGRGKGYGTDALNTIVKYAFEEMRLNCIYAEVLEYNTVSLKLFDKCGFIKDGILRSRIYKNGRYLNVVALSKLRENIV